MFEFLKDKKNTKKKDDKKEKEDNVKANDIRIHADEFIDIELSKDYKENLEKFKHHLKDASDAIFREFTIGADEIKCALVYIDGLTDKVVLHHDIMNALMQAVGQLEPPNQITFTRANAYNKIKDRALNVSEIKEVDKLDKAMFLVMSGETALIIDGSDKIIIANTRGWASRSIEEPESEGVIRGPRDGFVETLRTNTAALRRKCRDVNLAIEVIQVGRRSKTDVAVCYIKGIIDPKVLDEVKNRLNKIDIDEILGAGSIEQLIQDSTWSPFPQVHATERPDKAVASMMEGRAAIIIDGTPFVLVAPAIFPEFLQSPEDYYERWYIASLLRVLRWIAMFISIFAPALYIAVTSFHPGMIPTSLTLAIAASRENLPFPAIIEAGLMELTIELLREAGARLPKPIGQTIGIVGGIIIGDAAVRAGIASPILIIVVAVTAIASFVMPNYAIEISFRLLRFPMMILAAVFGLYGVMLGLILTSIHLANLKSFGVEYASPFMPFISGEFKDSIIRVPSKYMNKRPQSLNPVDDYRQPKDE